MRFGACVGDAQIEPALFLRHAFVSTHVHLRSASVVFLALFLWFNCCKIYDHVQIAKIRQRERCKHKLKTAKVILNRAVRSAYRLDLPNGIAHE